jgi:hypothetical protein
MNWGSYWGNFCLERIALYLYSLAARDRRELETGVIHYGFS